MHLDQQSSSRLVPRQRQLQFGERGRHAPSLQKYQLHSLDPAPESMLRQLKLRDYDPKLRRLQLYLHRYRLLPTGWQLVPQSGYCVRGQRVPSWSIHQPSSLGSGSE